MIDKYKRLIMESVPCIPAKQTTYQNLYCSVHSYCGDLGIPFITLVFDDAIEELEREQCLVYFDRNDVRPTCYGLSKFI